MKEEGGLDGSVKVTNYVLYYLSQTGARKYYFLWLSLNEGIHKKLQRHEYETADQQESGDDKNHDAIHINLELLENLSKSETHEKENERDSEVAVPRKDGKGNCFQFIVVKKRKYILSIQVGK